MKLYKLTTKENTTRDETKWGEGITHNVPVCDEPRMCSNTVLHAYKNPSLALLLNPMHADFSSPNIWEAEGDVVVEDWGKCGCFTLTTTRMINAPEWYTGDKKNDVVALFAILCAESVLSVYTDKYPDDDRPQKAIDAAKEYLKTKNEQNANAAAYAANAAYPAANAANAAAYAAGAANPAADAAYAAAYAADAAADAAANAAIDFGALADEAVGLIMDNKQ